MRIDLRRGDDPLSVIRRPRGEFQKQSPIHLASGWFRDLGNARRTAWTGGKRTGSLHRSRLGKLPSEEYSRPLEWCDARPVVKRKLLVASFGMLLAQQAAAQLSPLQDERAAFRQAVDTYQIFVVAHCAPEEVRAYVTARAKRDRAFVRSLRKTDLQADYKQAVADRAERDSRTVYECIGPLPPPPPLLSTTSPASLVAKTEPQRHDTLAVFLQQEIVSSQRWYDFVTH